MKQTLISVLTPTHNRGKDYLPQTILSVQNQLEKGFSHEHIIVDNESKDNTARVVKELAKKDKRIIYIRNNRNLGAADGLNVAFKRSKGQLVVPLDDDDLLPPFSLQARYDFFQNNPKVKWAYGYSLFINSDNALLDGLRGYRVAAYGDKQYFPELLKGNYIPNGTVTVKRECIQAVGGWDPEIKTQDYEMWLKLAEKKIRPYLMPGYVCLYRVHTGQVSRIQTKDSTYTNERTYYKNKYAKYFKKYFNNKVA